MARAFVIVLDACGAGPLPDSSEYGDAGADTLGHLAAAVGGLHLPSFARLGLGSIRPLPGITPAAAPVLHGRLRPLGPGKDSTAGHWELMGVVMPRPLPSYPAGFPAEVVEVIVAAADGRGILGNQPSNGIEILDRCGAEHLASGRLIVYTSQDSVLQIAAHEDVLSGEELHRVCRRVRESLPPHHAVGRVIARPFRGRPGSFSRTPQRRDFSIRPPARSYLEALRERGVPVHTVGKAGQLFDGIGVDVQHRGADNATALASTTALLESLEHGLVFTNLIETDQVYGHRHDVEGFHRALQEIDRALAGWLERLGAEDLLVLSADHGCDPTASHTDHTREQVPLLACFAGHGSRRHDGVMADVGASALAWLTGVADEALPGEPFVPLRVRRGAVA